MLFRSAERLKQDFFSHIVSSPESFPLDANSDETELLFSNLSDFISSYLTSTNQKITSLLKESSQGIFFINPTYRIEEEYSASILEYFGIKSLANVRLDILLSKKIPPKKVEELKEFLTLMFKNEIDVEDVEELNPLKQLEYSLQHKDGSIDLKLFDFEFKRIIEHQKVKYLTVFITDIKKRKELEEKLFSKSEELNKQFDIFFTLMTIDPSQFEDFLEDIGVEIKSVHVILKDTNKSETEKLEGLFNAVSYITEYTKALNVLDLFQQIEKLNYKTQNLKIKENITASDFFPVLFLLNDLENHVEYLSDFNKQFLEFKNKYVRRKNAIESNFIEFVGQSIDRISKGKFIPKLKYELSEIEGIKPKLFSILKNVVEQLLSFTILYSCIKTENSEVSMRVHSTKPGELIFSYLDNGVGLEYDDLRFFYDNTFESEKPFFHYFANVQKRLKTLHPKITVDSEFGKFFELTIIFTNK